MSQMVSVAQFTPSSRRVANKLRVFRVDVLIVDKVIVGSFHGFLRIYNPRPSKKEDGGWTGFRPEDVMVETQLQFPVLQVEAGIFIA